jgi:hypothetical protein
MVSCLVSLGFNTVPSGTLTASQSHTLRNGYTKKLSPLGRSSNSKVHAPGFCWVNAQ